MRKCEKRKTHTHTHTHYIYITLETHTHTHTHSTTQTFVFAMIKKLCSYHKRTQTSQNSKTQKRTHTDH